MNELAYQLSDTLFLHSTLRAFLRLIREGETSQDDSAYFTIVGGERMASLDRHPKKLVYIKRLDVWSTAAGAYQFIWPTWRECAAALDLRDFGRQAQDVAAVYLIRRRLALDDVIEGRTRDAIEKCSYEWASLPGDRYRQGGLSMDRAMQTYRFWLDGTPVA